jgi:hypothetical protein
MLFAGAATRALYARLKLENLTACCLALLRDGVADHEAPRARRPGRADVLVSRIVSGLGACTRRFVRLAARGAIAPVARARARPREVNAT